MELSSIPSFVDSDLSEIDRHYIRALEHFDDCSFAEVGVFFGRSIIFLAQEIKRRHKTIKVFAIDTWEGRLDDPFDSLYRGRIALHGGSIYDQFLRNVKDAEVEDVVIPIRRLSWHGAEQIEDESLAMVFIDAGHSYEDCTRDVQAYWPKLRKGGWLTGHDFNYRFPGVVEAVQRFAEGNGFSVTMIDSVWKVEKQG